MVMSFTLHRFLLACIICIFPSGLLAQQQDRFDDTGLSVQLGETELFPSIRLDYLQNSNAFLQSSNETTATDVTISPELNWLATRRLVNLQATYNGRYNVSSEEVLSVDDHRLALSADAELTSRKRLSGNVSLDFGHDEVSDYVTSASAQENFKLVTFTDLQTTGAFRYGANRARGNVSIGASLRNYNYTSRSDLTAGRSYLQIEPFAEFSLRLSGDTRLLSEIRFGTFQFEDSDQDRNDLSLLAGIQFDATGKSGGSLRMGILQSNKALATAEDQTVFVLRTQLFWEPASFSRFTLDGSRALDNTGSSLVDASEPTAVTDVITLRWIHQWSSRLSHSAVFSTKNVNRNCPSLDTRTLVGGLEVNFQIRRWLSVGVNGSSTSREVSDCDGVADTNSEYERSLLGAHIRATL